MHVHVVADHAFDQADASPIAAGQQGDYTSRAAESSQTSIDPEVSDQAAEKPHTVQ